jgi:antitoxin ParD1/3/4
MNISLPDGLKAFVDQQVSERGFASSSEFVRDLIRKELDRQHLRGLIMEGAESPVAGPADKAYFERLRARAKR